MQRALNTTQSAAIVSLKLASQLCIGAMKSSSSIPKEEWGTKRTDDYEIAQAILSRSEILSLWVDKCRAGSDSDRVVGETHYADHGYAKPPPALYVHNVRKLICQNLGSARMSVFSATRSLRSRF
jgi:hypothetical protein